MKEYHKIHSVFKRDENGKFTSEFSRDEFAYLFKSAWAFSEKVDGTNIRIGLDITDAPRLKIGGRTDNAQIPAYLLESIYKLITPASFMKLDNAATLTLYGEGYGAKIQKGGGNYRKDTSFVLFDVRVGDWWLRREDVEAVATTLGIDVVPILDVGMLSDAIEMCRRGFNSSWGNFESEGLVLRPKVDLFDRNGNRIITKVKCKDFK